MAISRAGFLGTLMKKAKENGNTIYEELQGNSVVASAVGDWNEAIKRTKAGVDKAAALISPTIDATPGKRTIEDTIDEFIFDPRSNLAPLELFALGAGSASKAAVKGLTATARKLGWKLPGASKRIVRGVADPLVRSAPTGKAPKVTTRVVEGLKHDVGGASIESMNREARGELAYRVTRSGKATPILQNAEDAVAGSADAIVRVVPGKGFQVQSGNLVGRRMQDAAGKLKPGKVRDLGPAKTHRLKSAADDDDFLKSLGVTLGKGPQ